jgi:tRNA U34 5-methylaminomethyl-2-thiouridine-forming methyltransferase MnmC
MPKRSLHKTDDGSYTIYNEDIDECYHSKFGAIAESQYVFFKNGLELIQHDEITIFEVGFGTGLNALLAVIYSESKQKKIQYIGIEKYPIENDLISGLDYSKHLATNENIFKKLHHSSWERNVEITPFFSLLKIKQDLNEIDFTVFENIDLIFFDAFSPGKQPELWIVEIFMKLNRILKPGGILVTYASSGIVKSALRQAGFEIKRLKGPPGKHHMILAKKNPD